MRVARSGLARRLLLASIVAVPISPAAAGCVPRRQAVALRLADFASPAEIVRPPIHRPLRAVAVLFAGSDVADLDGAIVGIGGRIVSRPLRQVADRLACAGIASLRYDKRYVTGATSVDRARFDKLDGIDLAADGRAALAFVRARPSLAGRPLALVGWSEGTTVAMAVAAAEPDVRALVLMAPVIASPAATAQAQYRRVGRPYLMRYATDAALDADAIARADQGPGGVLAHVFVRMFRGFRPGERVNPLLDANGDGRIGFAEADPVIASWYADGPGGGLGIAATGRALKGVADAFTSATPPILVVQGLNDAMVDAALAQAFAARPDAVDRVTLLTYAGLGHSLGPARSAQEDPLLPTAERPLADLSRWLARTIGAPLRTAPPAARRAGGTGRTAG